MRILARILLNGVGLWAAAALLPGLHWEGGLLYLLVAGFVIGLINVFVKPIVSALSCPLLILTLGLFYLVINGAMLWLADLLLDKFHIDSFLWAIAGGLFLGVFNLLLKPLVEAKED
ncbi:MAG: phage holin family protein [Thermoanaerobaculia bacterium]|jgi:putative membrane protein|nr:MAG: phage holin family protein [Thermoanaerobaculia bacterium]MBZ0102097.1 phage holin family protein [Thermoanaerobaculia bacterium]